MWNDVSGSDRLLLCSSGAHAVMVMRLPVATADFLSFMFSWYIFLHAFVFNPSIYLNVNRFLLDKKYLHVACSFNMQFHFF